MKLTSRTAHSAVALALAGLLAACGAPAPARSTPTSPPATAAPSPTVMSGPVATAKAASAAGTQAAGLLAQLEQIAKPFLAEGIPSTDCARLSDADLDAFFKSRLAAVATLRSDPAGAGMDLGGVIAEAEKSIRDPASVSFYHVTTTDGSGGGALVGIELPCTTPDRFTVKGMRIYSLDAQGAARFITEAAAYAAQPGSAPGEWFLAIDRNTSYPRVDWRGGWEIARAADGALVTIDSLPVSLEELVSFSAQPGSLTVAGYQRVDQPPCRIRQPLPYGSAGNTFLRFDRTEHLHSWTYTRSDHGPGGYHLAAEQDQVTAIIFTHNQCCMSPTVQYGDRYGGPPWQDACEPEPAPQGSLEGAP